LSNTATLSAAWAEKGLQPIIDCKQAKKERVTGFGCANPLTGQLGTNFAETRNAKTFKKHLRKVLRQYHDKQKIIIYVDNIKFHHANILKPFHEVYKKLEIRYLPAHLPDLNHVEKVWRHMRKSITHNRYLSSCLKERIAKFWRLLSACSVPNLLLYNLCIIKY
jgi:transposase